MQEINPPKIVRSNPHIILKIALYFSDSFELPAYEIKIKKLVLAILYYHNLIQNSGIAILSTCIK